MAAASERDLATALPEGDAAAATLERAVALRRIPGLEDLDPDLLTTLAARTELRRHAAGGSLAGHALAAIHLVLEGRVLESRGRGAERSIERGGLVGDLGALFEESGPFRAVAAVDSVTLALPLEDLIDLCEEHFGLLVAALRAAARAALASGRREGTGVPSAAAPPRARGSLALGDRILALSAGPLFAEVAVHTLGRIASEAKPLALGPGDALWREGEPAGCLVTILDGALACRDARGDFEVGPGALLGLLEALAGVPRSFAASAATPVSALVLESSALLDAMEDDSDLAVDVLAALVRSLSPARSDAP
jgi:CRP-like cAMP-binding protein